MPEPAERPAACTVTSDQGTCHRTEGRRISLRQLDLFAESAGYFLQALERLGRLDLEGVEQALAKHERVCPKGPDPAPVRAAAQWLAEVVPPIHVPERGPEVFSLCLALLTGEEVEPFLIGRKDLCRQIVGTLARGFLEAARARGIALENELTHGLPWGVFGLWCGELSIAYQTLQRSVQARPVEPFPWLALGDALNHMGRPEPARAAYREGFGLAPLDSDWPVTDPGIERIRHEVAMDPLWDGPWWVVGAYEEGLFPRYGRLTLREMRQRQDRMHGFMQAGRPAEAFFLGLAISEAGAAVDIELCTRVRRTMRHLNPAAFERHMERLLHNV